MWILDSCYRNGSVDLWDRGGGMHRTAIPCPPRFYLHLPDPHAHHGMIRSLESMYPVEECMFTTVSGELPGYRITAGREVAVAIERQTRFSAQLYNVDLRRDQQYMAEQGIVPCAGPGESRFSPDPTCDLRAITVRVQDNPSLAATLSAIEVVHEKTEHLSGREEIVLSDLIDLVAAIDPEVILFPSADIWMARLAAKARGRGFDPPFSRNGKFRQLDSRSYWSYGRMEHREGALIPDGRILIDTEQSFVFREGGLPGVLVAARLTGLSPNLASRFTPGTLVSGYEVYEAARRGISVPFRKRDAESVRRFEDLRAADRGGMMFQPEPGVSGNVYGIDFTSLYPSIIVQANLSPETIGHPGRPGFLPAVLDPLLAMRRFTKQAKKTDRAYAGIDSVLKWMLVTCFGYTGYKNAKFGRIEVHEGITARARDVLLAAKDTAEEGGFCVLHGIVDCLWVKGNAIKELKARIEQRTGLFTEVETYSWLVFLPMADGTGAYNRYYGRLDDGSVRVRGIAARRHDTPPYIRRMQQEMLSLMAQAEDAARLAAREEPVKAVYARFAGSLHAAPAEEVVIERRISRLSYAHACLEGAAVDAYRKRGIWVAPGMKIGYVVRDARRYAVDTTWDATTFDVPYYRTLLDRAWEEIAFAFRSLQKDREKKGGLKNNRPGTRAGCREHASPAGLCAGTRSGMGPVNLRVWCEEEKGSDEKAYP
jgi:DNA polymerase I